MLDAPRQDWSAYEARTRASDRHWLQGLSIGERLALYCEMFNFVETSRDPHADWRALERWHWEQKVQDRRRLVEALKKFDAFRERPTNHHPC